MGGGRWGPWGVVRGALAVFRWREGFVFRARPIGSRDAGLDTVIFRRRTRTLGFPIETQEPTIVLKLEDLTVDTFVGGLVPGSMSNAKPAGLDAVDVTFESMDGSVQGRWSC